ncbi:zinc ribbon domain-containing protein [bacterium]|nr:zinc ribbon domain-containing protein [bacterium]
MPIYEFKCTKCKTIFEDRVPVGQHTHKCPICGGKAKKQISSVGIIFKGSGWYCTDNRRGSTLNGNGSKKKDKKEVEKVESTDMKKEKVESKKSDSSESKSDDKK